MPILTALVLAAFAGYGAAWYFGAVEGNFALLLFVATAVTGLYWLADRFYFLPRRRAAAAALEANQAQRRAELAARGIPASRIKTISYGKERPVAVCNDISCWSQNRRAVTVLSGGQS